MGIKELMKEPEPIKVPLKEMGMEVGNKHVYFHSHFLSDKCGASQFDATDDFFFRRQKIVCPYCGGIIKLVGVEPHYSGGMSAVPMTMHHSSNEYTFKCDCGANLFGTYQWMWID